MKRLDTLSSVQKEGKPSKKLPFFIQKSPHNIPAAIVQGIVV